MNALSAEYRRAGAVGQDVSKEESAGLAGYGTSRRLGCPTKGEPSGA